jgi:hypothetical protein
LLPGCLTSEYEERETQAAESLRTVPRLKKQFFRQRAVMEETSAV